MLSKYTKSRGAIGTQALDCEFGCHLNFYRIDIVIMAGNGESNFYVHYIMCFQKEKEKCDCIIYLLWKTGRFLNKKIASLVGLTYSSISKQVILFRKRLLIDKELEKKIMT